MVAALDGAQVAHSHTWYANLAGHLGGLLHDIPHVVTVHSLEPLRPWKAEQLGGGYALSSWAEKVSVEGASAIVAVSEGMRADLLSAYPDVDPGKVHVIYNGIDAEQYSPDPNTDVIERYGVDTSRPSVVFVGRITRQKGVPVLLRAAAHLDPDVQLVLCAGAPDTPGAGGGGRRAGRRAAQDPLGGHLAVGDAEQAGGHPAAVALDAVRLPVGVRAAGHREPGGDGLRDGGRRVEDRRHPRGGRGRRDGLLVPPDDPEALAESINSADPRPGAGEGDGRRGPRAGARRSSTGARIAQQTAELYRSRASTEVAVGDRRRGGRARSTVGSDLLARAEPGGPAADGGPLHRGAAPRAVPVGVPVRRSRCRCARRRGGWPPGSPSAGPGAGRELVGAQSVDPAPRVEPGLPQRLVGEEVAHAREHGLVQQPRLDRGGAAPDPVAERGRADPLGVGSEGGEVGVEPDPAEAALVEQAQRAAVGEGDREPGPVGAPVGLLGGGRRSPATRSPPSVSAPAGVGDEDPAAHPEVQAEHRPGAGRLPRSRTTATCPAGTPR